MIFLKSAFACKTKLLLDSARQNSCSCKTNPTQYSFRKADFLWEKHAFRKLSILVVWDVVDIPVGNPSVFGGLWWEVSSSRAARVGQEEEWKVSGGQTYAHWMDSEQEVCMFPLSLSLRITVVGNVTLTINNLYSYQVFCFSNLHVTSDLLNLPLCFKLFSFHRGHNLLISLCVSICTFSFWDVTQTLAPCNTYIDLIPSEYKASIANTYIDTFRQLM